MITGTLASILQHSILQFLFFEDLLFIFLVVKLLIKVNEIKVKKGVELAQHLVEFYYAQVK